MSLPGITDRMMLALLCQILACYGVYFTLNMICLHYLIRNKNRNYAIVAFTVLSLIASTAFMTANVKSTEAYFIPSESTKALQKSTLLTSLISYESKLCLADSLLIYRLWVISEGNWLFVLPPFVLLMGTVGTVLADIITVSIGEFNETSIHLGVTVHSCSVALNILATSMIIVTLWRKRQWAKNLGLDHAKVYLSMTAIFAESGALYAVVGLIYIPLIVVNNPVTFFYSTWMDFAAGFAPLLILLRLAFGVAISRNTLTNMSKEVNTSQQQTKASEIAFTQVGNYRNTDKDSISGQKEEV